MSYKTVIFGLLALVALTYGQTCCDTEEAMGDFWSFKKQGKECALNIDLFDGLKLEAALKHIVCTDYSTLIINGRHMTEPFVASEEDLAAIPELTKVVYENIQSAQIDKDDTGSNLKSLNLVGSEDFQFHPSLLDETEFIEFDGVKLQYNSDERIFKLSQTDSRGSGPRAESLVSSQNKEYVPSDFEILLMVICGVQLLVIGMIVVVSCSAKAAKKEQLSRIPTNSSISSAYSCESECPSRKISTISSDESDQAAEIHECSIMIEKS